MGTRGEREREQIGRLAMLRVVRIAGEHQHDTERLVRAAVANALDHGATWAEIGHALNINGEAAAKRYRS